MTKLLAAITGNPAILLWLVLGAFGLGLSGGGVVAWKVQGVRLDSLRNEFTKFKQDTEALGKQAEVEKKAKEAADKLKKDVSDAKLKTAQSAAAVAGQRLRDDRAHSGFVPQAAPGAGSPDTACFSRPELERALQRLDDGVSKLIVEGDQNTVRLKSAQEWAIP